MKNIYPKNKNIFGRIIFRINRFILLLLIPASVSAQDSLDCCIHISSSPDVSNPFLVHFCISPCNEENSFEIFWDFGDGSPLVFSSDTCITHLYPVPAGNFNVCISSAMCLPGGVRCEYDTCIMLTVSHVGMNELSDDSGFDLFPNPSAGFINVYSASEILSVELLNLLGKKVFSCEAKRGFTQIPVSDISPGTYWVKIISANRKPVFKKIQVNN